MKDDSISMVQECVSKYSTRDNADGGITITIDIPKKYADLWLIRLSELRTSKAEIDAMEANDI